MIRIIDRRDIANSLLIISTNSQFDAHDWFLSVSTVDIQCPSERSQPVLVQQRTPQAAEASEAHSAWPSKAKA